MKNISLKDRIFLYNKLATLLDAGIPILQALEKAANIKATSLRAFILNVREQIQKGKNLADAIKKIDPTYHPNELMMIKAAEASGNLAVVLKMLVGQMDQESKLLKEIKGRFTYPLFLIHAGALIFPLPGWLGDQYSFFIYCLKVGGVLAPVYFINFLVKKHYLARQAQPTHSPLLETLMGLVPLTRRIAIHFDLYRAIFSYLIMMQAGVDIKRAMKYLIKVPKLSRIKKAFVLGQSAVNRGNPLTAGLCKSSIIPDEVIEMWQVGEETGKLEDQLNVVLSQMADDLQKDLKSLAFWFPMIIKIIIIIAIGYQIISFYTGYFDMIKNL